MSGACAETSATQVMTLGDIDARDIRACLERFALTLQIVADNDPIPASYWGQPEAGLVGTTVFARGDTPVHSILHEACHVICMSEARRAVLERDAGGGYDEENAVCYLQLVLAGSLPRFGFDRACADMDAWGYTFRLGSARRWFERDSTDARDRLERWGLLDNAGRPTGRLRDA